MRALIFEVSEAVGAGGLDIAGRPLVVRQLQWLRDLGIEEVVIELAQSKTSAECAETLLGSEPLFSRCTVIPTRAPLGCEGLARRAGLPADELFLALPANTLVHAHFELPTRAIGLAIALPTFAPPGAAPTLVFRTLARPPTGEPEPTVGWAISVLDAALAHAASCALLERALVGPLVHAAEVRPGIWLARGARVSEDALLVPPVLVDRDARVFSKARVGPNVIVGAGAVVEREAVLSEVRVSPGVLVGEGARFRQALVDAAGMTSLADGARTKIDDGMVLAHVAWQGPSPAIRVAALTLCLLLWVPWLLLAGGARLVGRRPLQTMVFRGRRLSIGSLGSAWLDLLPALFDVVLGRRDLVGVAARELLEIESAREDGPSRVGAFDISRSLAPRGSTSTLLWLWRWYLRNKTPQLDRDLLLARSPESK
jgi:hypothetical protein